MDAKLFSHTLPLYNCSKTSLQGGDGKDLWFLEGKEIIAV